MQNRIKEVAERFLDKIKDKNITVISHHDTDGITSAAIMAKTLKRLEKTFSVKLVKQLEKEVLRDIKKEEVVVILDLGSSNIEDIEKMENDVFIIDHHEVKYKGNGKIFLINPHLFDEDNISAAGLTYMFSKEISDSNRDLARLAVLGMVGDTLDQEINRFTNQIIKDSEVVVKKGPLLYPATRPINKVLEFSSSIFIPGITGDAKAISDMLRDIDIRIENGRYKSLIELNDEELSRLMTSIILKTGNEGLKVGNIYLIKFMNKLEDARELSAMVNACSRLGRREVALGICLENKNFLKQAETIYAEYKQNILRALKYAEQNKVEGKGYIIINAKDNIRDTIVGTTASILSMSNSYSNGTVIVAMAYDADKVKVSARLSGKNGRNVKELLDRAMENINGEVGGHACAAGCLICKEQEHEFLQNLIKNLEMEIIKI